MIMLRLSIITLIVCLWIIPNCLLFVHSNDSDPFSGRRKPEEYKDNDDDAVIASTPEYRGPSNGGPPSHHHRQDYDDNDDSYNSSRPFIRRRRGPPNGSRGRGPPHHHHHDNGRRKHPICEPEIIFIIVPCNGTNNITTSTPFNDGSTQTTLYSSTVSSTSTTSN